MKQNTMPTDQQILSEEQMPEIEEHIERMAKILKCEAMDIPVEQAAQRLVNFRTRVINLCNEKAAEWERDGALLRTMSLTVKAQAANELREAIVDHKGE